VPFDVGAARQAAEACRSAAVRVLAVAGDRRRLATPAQRDWRGPHRDAFDWEITELTLRHERVADALRTFAAAVDAAIDRAAAENRRREEAAAATAANAGAGP
jgi:uncharacterized protein YukE